MSETLAELLDREDFDKWIEAQPPQQLKRLADKLIDMDLVADPEAVADYDDFESDAVDILAELRDLISVGRIDDAMVLIERTAPMPYSPQAVYERAKRRAS